MRSFGRALWCVLLCFAPCAVDAQLSTLGLQNFWYPDDAVNAVLESDGRVYLGGRFNYIGPYTGGAALLYADSGARDEAFPIVEGGVNTIVSDGNGGWFLGGTFTAVGGLERRGLAHIRNDLTVDPNWSADAPGGYINALAVYNGSLFVGGTFKSIGGQSRTNLAAVDVTSGAVSDFNPGLQYGRFVAAVLAMATDATGLYVAGGFTSIAGVARTNLAKLDPATGAALAWDPGADGLVSAMLVTGGTVYAGGRFKKAGGVSSPYIAAIDTTTGIARPWPTNANGWVNALALSGEKLYVAGEFSRIGGATNRIGIAALSVTTGLDTGWNPGRMSPAYALAVSGRTLFVGGGFKAPIENRMAVRLAAVDVDTGNLLAGWNTGADRTVAALSIVGTRLCVGGSFSSTGGFIRNALAAFDANTGRATPWNPDAGVTGPYQIRVNALAAANGVIYAAGSFTNIGSSVRTNLAAIDLTTGSATAWNPNPDGQVLALALTNNFLFAGGTFNAIGGQRRTNLAAVDLSTGAAGSWSANVSGSVVRALGLSGANLFVGGSFSAVGGQNRNNIACVSVSDGSVLPWNASCEGLVYALGISSDAVYVGGRFSTVNGKTRRGLAALDLTSGGATSWDPALAYNYNPASLTVFGLGVSGDLVFVAGLFDMVGTEGRIGVAAIDRASGLASPWYAGNGIYDSASTVSMGNGRLYIGSPYSLTDNVWGSYFQVYGAAAPPTFSLVNCRFQDGLFQFRLSGSDGQSYAIEASHDLSLWQTVETVGTTAGNYDFTDPASSTNTIRFYRIRLGP